MDVRAFILKAVEEYKVSRDLVCLEITESVLAQDTNRMQGIVKGLRSAGFQIWMDDFGSGYSSLTFLNDYTLDCIKLDMDFLKSFTRTSMEIVRSTVKMAKRLASLTNITEDRVKDATIVPEDRQILARELQKEYGNGQTKEIS